MSYSFIIGRNQSIRVMIAAISIIANTGIGNDSPPPSGFIDSKLHYDFNFTFNVVFISGQIIVLSRSLFYSPRKVYSLPTPKNPAR